MISKNTYRVLKAIPLHPETITLNQLHQAQSILNKSINISLLVSIIENGLDNKFIGCKHWTPGADIHNLKLFRTEDGQIALEEYKRNCSASFKSTLALIVSGFSLWASIFL